jgi:hypothetical protein
VIPTSGEWFECETRGGKGCSIHSRGESIRVEGEEVEEERKTKIRLLELGMSRNL